jgi:glycosyltransferase involved in cell wall biosynthesis
MKLIYIHNTEINSEKANNIQVISMCNAFALNGIDVELVFPVIKEEIENPHNYIFSRFNIRCAFKISFYKKLEFFNRLYILGSYFGVKNFLKKSSKADIYYTRSTLIFYLIARKKLPVIFEIHNSKIHINIKTIDRFWSQKVIKYSKWSNCLAVISISDNLSEYWKNQGVPGEKIFTLHDGFNKFMFKRNITIEEARLQLNLQKDRKIVVYTGSLYADREIENIIDLASEFSEGLFLVIGGPKSNSDYYQSLAKDKGLNNIEFRGPVSHKDIPLYLYAGNILLALWSDKVPTINYCSPLKLFEYMAAGRIIVAHGYPSIREVIRHKENGMLVTPGDAQDLVKQLRTVWNGSGLTGLGERARAEAFLKYTWCTRAKQIISKVREVNR